MLTRSSLLLSSIYLCAQSDADGTPTPTPAIEYTSNFFYVGALIIGCFIVLFAAASIHHHCVHNDFYRPRALFNATFNILDLTSDIFLALQIWTLSERDVLYLGLTVFSVWSIAVPILLSLFQLMWVIWNEWSRDGHHTDDLKLYLARFSKILFLMSFATGSAFTAVDLATSHLFSCDLFSLPLTNMQFLLFQSRRIWSIVLLENIPQVIIQAVYMWQLGEIDKVAVASMFFSSISIIVTITSVFTQRFAVNSSGYAVIRFSVTGDCLTGKAYVARTQVHGIRDQLGSLLGISSPKLVEVLKPQIVPQGLLMVIHIHLNDIQFKDVPYKHHLEHFQENGRLAEIFRACWRLDSAPICSTIEFGIVEAANRNTVKIAMQSKSATQSVSPLMKVNNLSPQSSHDQPSCSTSSRNVELHVQVDMPLPDPVAEIASPEQDILIHEFQDVVATFTPEED